ncbi:MAG TPA: serine/threonine-protein kinase, partial [Polyangiaceae bacterium]|nr:serine/threonine-protein kinase [Polyangiaceae bacterium]
RARFEREAHAVNRFRHPGAIRISDIDVTDDGEPFLVMELAVGQTLAVLARSRPVPVGELLVYMDQLLDVLAAAHREGIVHRDVKPDNLVIQPDGRLRVLDFGVARFEGSILTAKGAPIGTAPFMAPEQVRSEGIDARTDVFGVGATMFRVMAGRPVHVGESAGEVLLQAATTPPPRLEALVEAPDAVVALVNRALSFEPDDRFRDALEMQAEVRDVIRSLKGSADWGRVPPRRIEDPRTMDTTVSGTLVSTLAETDATRTSLPDPQRRSR